MTTLHLGIIDVPYSQASYRKVSAKSKRFRKGRALRGDEGTNLYDVPTNIPTTGDVATWLENKYHIMEVFAEDVGLDAIDDALAHSVAGAIQNLVAGIPPEKLRPTAEAMGELESAFRHFLSQEEMAGLGVPGVPTKAALKGVNRRLLHPFAKGNPRRPSFLDTGLYSANAKFWIDE